MDIEGNKLLFVDHTERLYTIVDVDELAAEPEVQGQALFNIEEGFIDLQQPIEQLAPSGYGLHALLAIVKRKKLRIAHGTVSHWLDKTAVRTESIGQDIACLEVAPQLQPNQFFVHNLLISLDRFIDISFSLRCPDNCNFIVAFLPVIQ